MRFLMREIAGWLLLVIGLFILYSCFVMLANERPPRIIEAVPLTLIGVIVFRGGIQLLKVAVAARICLRAQEQLEKGGPAVGRPTATVRRAAWVPPSRRVS